MLKALNYLFVASMLWVGGCQLQGKEPPDPDKKNISSRDLYRVIRSQKKILLVDAWENQVYRDSIRQMIQEFHLEDWELIIKDHQEVTEEEVSSTPTVLLGKPDQNSWTNNLLENLPFSIEQHQIGIADQKFDLKSHSLVLSYYPNPLNVKMPIGIFISENEALVWTLVKSRITSFFRANWDYQIFSRSQKVLLGNFSQKPVDRWEVDSKQQILLPSGTLSQWSSGAFRFKSYSEKLNQASMRALVSECQRELTQIEELSGKQWEGGHINYYLYPSTEMKGLITGNTDQSHLNESLSEVHTAFDDHFQGRYFGMENRLLLRQILGEPSFEFLEIGLSVYFSSSWQKQGYRYWASHLINGGNAITAAQLLDQDHFSGFSALIVEALAGSFAEFLLNHWGTPQFLQKYHSWSPQRHQLETLNKAWWKWVKSSSYQEKSIDQKQLPYLRGFNFTHEGYQIYNGYGSVLSSKSMERVRELGSNAVAIVPYSWMRDPTDPSIFRFSDRAGSENDEGVIHAISKAKSNGLFTLLKPHVWISGGWPGEVEMRSKDDWNLFFEQYYQWISHYALLAEMHQVDALCIGVEFSKATLSQEGKWRELIHKIRMIYSGKLTYAANWGEEFEGLEFWDQLDFMGLNCYYPLSQKQGVNKVDLVNGFTSTLKKVKAIKSKYKKPVVLTEIGFRSIEAPWLQPHAEAGTAAFNEEHQAICYEAVFEAMSQYPVVDGILWWKWPTNLEMTAEQDRRFVPAGKMAETVVKHWFVKKTPPEAGVTKN